MRQVRRQNERGKKESREVDSERKRFKEGEDKRERWRQGERYREGRLLETEGKRCTNTNEGGGKRAG